MPKTAALIALPVMTAMLLAGCAKEAPELAADPVDQAATCGVIAAATARETAGVKGDLPADAQARIFHYPLLAGSTGTAFDDDRADAVFKRMPKLFDATIKGKWQTLRPACATAFPQTQITEPTLPVKPRDALLQCYMLAEFMRKALGNQGASYGEAVTRYGVLSNRIDAKLSPMLAAAGIHNGPALKQARAEALAAVARLGQPPAVISACETKYP